MDTMDTIINKLMDTWIQSGYKFGYMDTKMDTPVSNMDTKMDTPVSKVSDVRQDVAQKKDMSIADRLIQISREQKIPIMNVVWDKYKGEQNQ